MLLVSLLNTSLIHIPYLLLMNLIRLIEMDQLIAHKEEFLLLINKRLGVSF